MLTLPFLEDQRSIANKLAAEERKSDDVSGKPKSKEAKLSEQDPTLPVRSLAATPPLSTSRMRANPVIIDRLRSTVTSRARERRSTPKSKQRRKSY